MKKSAKSTLIGLIAVLMTLAMWTGISFAASPADGLEKGGQLEIVEKVDPADDGGQLEIEVKVDPCSEGEPLDNDSLFKGYIEKQLSLKGEAKRKSSQGANLTAYNKGFYDALKPKILLVAAGERDDTVFVLTVDELGLEKNRWSAKELGVTSILDNGSVTQEAINAFTAMMNIDLNAVIRALLADCPYEMYWYDKTVGSSMEGMKIGVTYDYSAGEYMMGLSNAGTISMTVAQAYSAGDYKVNTVNAQRVQHAVQKAASIVEETEHHSDLERLIAYRQAICGLVTYDYTAAGGNNIPYGDPWQIISVFDEDEDTNVVCEGYSKSFQYLCDLTHFRGKVNCFSVSGTMYGGTGAGGHMWNILHMEDGKNYLADVTNCDEGAVGANDQLFLVGYTSGNVESGYVYTCNGYYEIRYEYDANTIKDYGDLLVMSDRKYVECADIHEMVETEAVPATCTEDGNIHYWTCNNCGRVFTDANGENEIEPEDVIIRHKGHQYGEMMRGVSPTCDTTGMEPYCQCTVCEKYFDQNKNEKTIEELTIPALGHDFQTQEGTAVAATCEKTGKNADLKCSRCGIMLEGPTIPALGHDYHTEAGTAVTATCDQTGKEADQKCSRCGNVIEGAVIPALGHDFQVMAGTAVAATCEQTGKEADQKCSRCGIMLEGHMIPALGHNYGALMRGVSPTCTTTGFAPHYQCELCGKYLDQNKQETTREELTIPALGHDYQVVEGTEIAPTCEVPGKEADQKCSRCDDEIEGEVIPALGHTWNSAYTVDKKATYGAAGSKSIHCLMCDAIKPGSAVAIPKLKVAATTLTKVTAGKKAFIAKWKKASGITGYEIQYALNSKFTKGKKVVTIAKPATISRKVTKLKARKKYYVRIRTYKVYNGKKYYSAWTKAKTVTTKK